MESSKWLEAMAIKSNIIFKLWLALIPLMLLSSRLEITHVYGVLLLQLAKRCSALGTVCSHVCFFPSSGIVHPES